jgi:hypothetical protein
MFGIPTMAGKALVGKDWANVAIELDGLLTMKAWR